MWLLLVTLLYIGRATRFRCGVSVSNSALFSVVEPEPPKKEEAKPKSLEKKKKKEAKRSSPVSFTNFSLLEVNFTTPSSYDVCLFFCSIFAFKL